MQPSSMSSNKPRVTILLTTYNGAAHLHEQLDSFRAQDYPDWDLWVSDDGSVDDTLDILETFRTEELSNRKVRILKGPERGHAANFLSLLCHPELPEGPVALSDQDDVWLSEKLRLAAQALQQAAPVALYGAQSYYTDQSLKKNGKSRIPRLPPSFRNALTQNIVSGHSTVLSAGALSLVRRAAIEHGIPHHDWWLYLLVSGAGGEVIIDRSRVVLYRQHQANAMGAHYGLTHRLMRARQVLGQTYAGWLSANLTALSHVQMLLTPENRCVLQKLRKSHNRTGIGRMFAMYQLGLHRQSRLSTVCFYLAAAAGRI
ncbi:glycosyltransferase [Tritonibacter mobilis]|uniref:glycosyltransferase n=1 Tax=Tritonibacter mobilis TaxID=379347 RepID=UPI0039A649FE